MGEHHVRGIGEKTRVECGKNSETYGPHPDAIVEFNFCPYCGDATDDESHKVDLDIQEVFCPGDNTMSTWRFCPNCGERVSDE